MESNHLPVIPRVGETVEIPFFRAYLDNTWFHVEKVRHEFTDTGQEVEIFLLPGEYNLYWHYRKDKAEEEGELHFGGTFNYSGSLWRVWFIKI